MRTTMSFKNLLKTLVLSSALLASGANAATPSAAQIEQFKKLPASQQQSLAKSMGVDLNALKMGSSPTEQVPVQVTKPVARPEVKKEIVETIDGKKNALQPFGYDVFANAPTTFTPNLDVAVPESYIVGPGDNISIQMFGKENLDYQLSVNREGQVVIPELGPFSVVGLTYSELKEYLKAQVQQRILGVNVVVSISSLRSMRIFVLGDAYKPGPYIVNSLSSVTHALFAAGGVSEIGSLRNIQIKRAGKLIQSFDLYDLLIKGDSSGDILLQAGDVVFVEAVGNRVSIDGEVRRAGIYEISSDETFNDVVKMAGGLLPSAYPQATRVERYNSNNLRSLINVDLTTNQDKLATVKNGDAIHVLKTSDLYDQSIEIIGAVTRPGSYQWHQGHKITDLFPSVNAYLLEDAELTYSIIVREVDIARNIEVLQFSLTNAISNPNSADNITLQPRDKVLVFTNTEEELIIDNDNDNDNDNDAIAEVANKSISQLAIEEATEGRKQYKLKDNSRFKLLAPVIQKLKQQAASGISMKLVEVDGQVKYPGIYPLANNTTVKSLLVASGGVTESAYLARAEITRNKVDSELAQKQSININLKQALNDDVNNNISLQSKDRLNVHTIPAWTENHTVYLRGEFKFPGKYTIKRGETLADIIVKAGGFTDYAFPEGGVFTREKLKKVEMKNLNDLSRELRLEIAAKSLTEGSDVTYDEAQKLLADLIDIEPVGRLVLDMAKVTNDQNYDVLLENGDTLFIPSKNNSINVIGQVNVSTSHMYDNHLSIEDYIRKSGGVKQRAEEDSIYVIAANGDIKTIEESNWFSTGSAADLQPGDTIVVPLDSSYMNDITTWSTVTQIMYNTAVAIAAISGL